MGIKQRARSAKFQEHFNQAQLFYNSLTDHEKAHLISAFSFELSHCDDQQVYETYTKLLNNIDYELAKTVAQNVNGILPDKPARQNHGKKDAALSQTHFIPKTPTIKSRRIAILIADGFNLAEVESVRAALASGLATTWIIGPRRGKIFAHGEKVGGAGLVADHHYEGQRSTLFDALYIPSGAEHAKSIASNGRAIHWIREAFGHCKAIGAIGDGKHMYALYFRISVLISFPLLAVPVVREAIGLPEIRVASSPDSTEVQSSYGVVTAGKYDVKSAVTDALEIATGNTKGFVTNFAYEISQHRCYLRETDGLISRVAY